MGDMSKEPSMEEILSSIKRIIAEEGEEAALAAPRRVRAEAAKPAAVPPVEQASNEDALGEQMGDEILELTEEIGVEEVLPAPKAASSKPAAAPQKPTAAPVAGPAATGAILSKWPRATRSPLCPQCWSRRRMVGTIRSTGWCARCSSPCSRNGWTPGCRPWSKRWWPRRLRGLPRADPVLAQTADAIPFIMLYLTRF